MRKHLALIATLIPFFVAAPVAAHHMAEGIVADDIYAMIDENLADSPHLLLDLTTTPTMTMRPNNFPATPRSNCTTTNATSIKPAPATNEGVCQSSHVRSRCSMGVPVVMLNGV